MLSPLRHDSCQYRSRHLTLYSEILEELNHFKKKKFKHLTKDGKKNNQFARETIVLASAAYS